MTEKHQIKTEGSAVCYNCGIELIAPADGRAYWCTECSYEEDYRRRVRGGA